MESILEKTGFFKRNERIKNPDDFKRLFKDGKKTNISGVKLFLMENGTDMNRIALRKTRRSPIKTAQI